MKKMLAIILAAVMALGCLTGCGNSEAKKVKVIDISLTSEEYAFGVDKNQPDLLAKANEFLKKIMEDGTYAEIENRVLSGNAAPVVSGTLDSSKDQLVVATNAAFKPFEYKGGSYFYGIDMEIAAKLAEYLGKELVIMDMEFDSVVLSVSQGKCDIAMAGLSVTEERKELVTFTDSYYNSAQKIIVMASNTEFDACKTAEDVEAVLASYDNKTKVGVQSGTTGEFYCKGDEDLGFDGFAFVTNPYSSGSLAVQDLVNGNVKFVIIDAAPAAEIAKAFNEMN